MIKAGILVDRLDGSQQGFCITTAINNISSQMINVDIIVFTQEFAAPPMSPLFATMPETDAWGFDGPIIATNLRSATTLINVVGPPKKYFYLWDLEWMRLENFTHNELSKIYNNDALDLIARSPKHNSLIQKCWKTPSFIMDDFNHKTLLKVIKNA